MEGSQRGDALHIKDPGTEKSEISQSKETPVHRILELLDMGNEHLETNVPDTQSWYVKTENRGENNDNESVFSYESAQNEKRLREEVSDGRSLNRRRRSDFQLEDFQSNGPNIELNSNYGTSLDNSSLLNNFYYAPAVGPHMIPLLGLPSSAVTSAASHSFIPMPPMVPAMYINPIGVPLNAFTIPSIHEISNIGNSFGQPGFDQNLNIVNSSGQGFDHNLPLHSGGSYLSDSEFTESGFDGNRCNHAGCRVRKDGALPREMNSKFCSRHKCCYPGCVGAVRSKSLCSSHGGGKRCHVDRCPKSAQGTFIKYLNCIHF